MAYSLPDLEPWVERAWPLTITKAASCDRVVAVFQGEPVAAWRLRGALPTDETYAVTTPRIDLALGDPLPIVLPTGMSPRFDAECPWRNMTSSRYLPNTDKPGRPARVLPQTSHQGGAAPRFLVRHYFDENTARAPVILHTEGSGCATQQNRSWKN
jgi:hypothetical protein